VDAKFYCPHALADDNQRIWIRKKTLEFSSTVFIGATENARHENTGRSKMQGWKMQDMNFRHQIAGMENARHENAAPICKGGKCGKS